MSKGDSFDDKFLCDNPECSTFEVFSPEKQESTGLVGRGLQEFDFVGKVDSCIQYDNKFQDTITINDFVFNIKELSMKEDITIESKFLINGNASNVSKYVLEQIYQSISSIKKGDDVIDLDISVEEFLNSSIFNLQDIKKLIEEFTQNKNTFSVKYGMECPMCKTALTKEKDDLLQILVF